MNRYEGSPAVVIERRKGTPDSPFSDMNESLVVASDGKVVLTEIPNELNRVIVTSDDNTTWYEIKNGKVPLNGFKVDYINKLVTFNIANVGKQLHFKYFGEGNHYYSLHSIYTKLEDGSVVETLGDLIENGADALDALDQLDQKLHEVAQATNNAIVATNDTNEVIAEGNQVITTVNGKITEIDSKINEATSKMSELDMKLNQAESTISDVQQKSNAVEDIINNAELLINEVKSAGEFNLSTLYKKNNIVLDNGSSWIALQETQNNPLPVLPIVENLYWRLVALHGLKGDTGAALSILGSLNDPSQLPITGQAGQAYTINGNLYVWSENLNAWENIGNIKGEEGKSAYEVAIANGFVGTSEEWLASLKGDKGQDADLTEVNQNISNLQLSSTKNQTDNLQRAINVKLPPTPLVAATGDGIVNDQPSIQAIIDYANLNNYDIYIPNGVYRLNDTLKRKGSVSIYGQNMMLTNLKFYKASGGTVIDTVNEPLHGVTMQGFKISKDTAVGGTTGILGGSTLQKYNSAIGQFKNIMIEGLTCGIAGNGEPSGVGIFDCLFENIFINNCFVGIRFDGSGNILKNARIVHCGTGISFEHLNTESFAGINVIGGVFVQNSFDIGIPNVEGIRPCSFNGTWFEQASNGLINIPNADTKLMSLSFRDCMLSINGTFPLLNFYNAIGAIKIDTCTIAQVNNSSVLITPPNNVESILKVSNSIQILNDGSRSILNYSKNENWLPLTLQNNWKNAFESSITKYFKTDDNVVHLQIAMRDGDVGVDTVVANLPEKFRPKQSVRFSIFDGTNNVPRHLYITSGGDVVIQTVANVTLLTGIWSGYVTFKADK